MQPGEKRPVVVCQHGLEGRPQDILQGDHAAYHDFAARLASRGFITFSPQNLYLFSDRFRSLQRRSYPLKKTLFSIIVAQHQQWVDWLQGLPFVDPERSRFLRAVLWRQDCHEGACLSHRLLSFHLLCRFQ